jgi:hypothetical protein
MWDTGFACLPGAIVDLLGIEYKTSEHEFNYLTEALLGGESPIIKKSSVKAFRNNVRSGDMILELTNGCKFQALSYEQKDTWRGAQVTVYNFNEAYQFPGLEAYTGIQQNLRTERGFATFTTTPDQPWVQKLHELGHGKNPLWHCVCGSTSYINPYSFDLNGFMTDAPDWETLHKHCPQLVKMCEQSGLQPGRLMSREKFLISWLGLLGQFVGRVYQFQQGGLVFNPLNTPFLWTKKTQDAWLERERHLAALRNVTVTV